MSARKHVNGNPKKLSIVGLFAGIGGLELGFERTGRFRTILFSENDKSASEVLETRFPNTPNAGDVSTITELPTGTDVVTAGFPCQDLSKAGGTRGIDGTRSGLVRHVFRLLENSRIPWVVLENVPFMLQLGRGAGMRFVADNLERLGYRWAYRVIDSRAFGLPHRRQRVFLLASRDQDPAAALLGEDAGPVPECKDRNGSPCGFYWTEGVRGLGWAVDAVPTLKGGSTVGIPSAPAVWLPHGEIVTPSIEAAERLQGFTTGWTESAERVTRKGHRWKLVGNAVTVDAAEWIANSLLGASDKANCLAAIPRPIGDAWPKAAYGSSDGRFAVDVSEWPDRKPRVPLLVMMGNDRSPLSERATAGFLKRFEPSSLHKPDGFLEALRAHLRHMRSASIP